MKTIDTIIIHCSASPDGKEFRAADIDLWHKEKGYTCIGYNYVVDLDGTVEVGRPTTMNGAHCKGWNDHSIGICYVGGVEAAIDKKGQIVAKLDEKGNPIPKDTRTLAQKEALHNLVEKLLDAYPSIIRVIGHRDTSPDLNGDGKITPNEWIRACPCFDVQAEFPMAYCIAKR
jgi:hypothetical protein